MNNAIVCDKQTVARLVADFPYVRELFPHSDVEASVGALAQDLASKEAGYTSVCFAERGASRWLAGVRPIAWDSDFFGFPISELNPLIHTCQQLNSDVVQAGEQVIKEAIAAARSSGQKLLYATVICADTAAHRALINNSFQLVDTLVTHYLKLPRSLPQPVQGKIREARQEDVEALAAISEECFGNRRHNVNRFNSDPSFPEAKVREMYRLWLERSVSGLLADKVLTFVEGGRPVAFITIKAPSKAEVARGVKCAHIPLNAVAPDQQGKGIYGQIVAAALHTIRDEMGFADVDIKTQLPNFAVHRAWSKLGASICQSVHRFHLRLN